MNNKLEKKIAELELTIQAQSIAINSLYCTLTNNDIAKFDFVNTTKENILSMSAVTPQ